ncbi:MAG TPA: class I tRNA ligase family protein, partial [Ignavibacteria bacterium]|nr:class I tRNA ligase family protein [Ignavibacteria bacterium]
MNEYKINEASAALYDFIWGDFCDWYIEILKIKANDNPASGEAIFENAINIFEDSIKLLHPVMPFITEELWQGIKERQADESISVSDMPQFDESIISIDAENKVNTIQQLMAAARNLR